MTRESSLKKDAVLALKDRGVNVVVIDLQGPKQDLVKKLQGMDVVISCIDLPGFDGQIALIEAAKEAGISRTRYRFWAPLDMPFGIVPVEGVSFPFLSAARREDEAPRIVFGWLASGRSETGKSGDEANKAAI